MSGMITPDGTCTVCGKTNVAPNHPFELPQSVTAPTPSAVAQAREGVWGALEDWQNTTRTTAQVHRDVDAALDAYAAAVRAECAAKVDAEPCDWLQDSDGLWRTDCGNLFEFNAGGPFENDMKFCGYCGNKLVEVPYEPMPDDDEEAHP